MMHGIEKKINHEAVIELCNAILKYYFLMERKEIEKDPVLYVKPKKLMEKTGIRKGRIVYGMAYLHRIGVAKKQGKMHGGTWKINMKKLWNELKKLEKHGK